MAARISSEDIAEFKECFNLYDRDKDGLISLEQLKLVMRSLGQCPSQSELNAMIKSTGKPKITFPEFLDLMWKLMQKSRQPERDIFDGFRVYDEKKQGVVSMKDLYHIMTRTGEKLTPQEFDYMLQQTGISKSASHVKYADVARCFAQV